MMRLLALAAAAAVSGLAATGTTAQPVAVDLVGLIDTYYHGRHDEAIARAAALPDLGPLRLKFVQETPGWIAADPARADRRRAAVAGFLVELAGARIESDWGRLNDLIEWTCAQLLRPSGPPTEFERTWHMATTALAGRARTRLWLLGPAPRLAHQKPRQPMTNDPPSPMHLMHALERFPDDPHFQLARVVAWTWGRDAEPIRNVRMRDDDDRRVPSRPTVLEAITALEPLLAVPAVAAEAHLRAGLVQVAARDHGAALRAFEAAQPLAEERQLKYLSHFLAGRALEALGRPEEAMAQYQRALTIIPAAESATVALASLQFLRSERDAAVALIDSTFKKTTTVTDPGRLTGYGYYLHWPTIRAGLRR